MTPDMWAAGFKFFGVAAPFAGLCLYGMRVFWAKYQDALTANEKLLREQIEFFRGVAQERAHDESG